MIPLHPHPRSTHVCPYCKVELDVEGWLIPGMRNLADAGCPACSRRFFGELPAGHAVHTPLLLEAGTGTVHGAPASHWSARWLADAYRNRSSAPVALEVEEREPIRGAVLLNCIDGLYGHTLLKLLNAQAELARGDGRSLVVLIPRIARWLVPDGVAGIWTADLPLARGPAWHDALAHEIHALVERFDDCVLSDAHPHPHPSSFQIERFTRVPPFPVGEWEARLAEPAVTYVWRPDRTWSARRARTLRRLEPAAQELANVVELAEALRAELPSLSFAVAGIGPAGGLPPWIADLRAEAPDGDAERALCARYAESHVVVGVHGSNMLLPSAHAGGVVELMPPRAWGNVVQDLLPRGDDVREALYRYRVVPSSTRADELATVVRTLILEHGPAMKGIGARA